MSTSEFITEWQLPSALHGERDRLIEAVHAGKYNKQEFTSLINWIENEEGSEELATMSLDASLGGLIDIRDVLETYQYNEYSDLSAELSSEDILEALREALSFPHGYDEKVALALRIVATSGRETICGLTDLGYISVPMWEVCGFFRTFEDFQSHLSQQGFVLESREVELSDEFLLSEAARVWPKKSKR